VDPLAQNEIEPGLFTVTIPVEALEVDRAEIAVLCGYTDGNIPLHFAQLIDQAFDALPAKLSIQGGYRVVPIEVPADQREQFILGDVSFDAHRIVTTKLRGSTHAALFVCTIGPGMETWAQEQQSEDPAFGFIINNVASVAAEAAVNRLHDHIGTRQFMEGLRTTNRYSPGYCSWSVEEQHKLFSFFPEGFCGVRLTDSALMWPIKSVSGIIGIGTDVFYREYSCSVCGISDCTYRSIRLARKQHPRVDTPDSNSFFQD